MLKGFKEFIMRGNLIELAVAFVIGAAFAKVVQDFVGAIVTPLINSLPGSKVDGFGFAIRHGSKFQGKNGNTTFIDLSLVINSLIVFVSTAAVVYFALVVPMNKVNERRALRMAKGEPDPTPKAEDIQLLEQIRDLLQSGSRRPLRAPGRRRRFDCRTALRPRPSRRASTSWWGGRSRRYHSSSRSPGPSPQPTSVSSRETDGSTGSRRVAPAEPAAIVPRRRARVALSPAASVSSQVAMADSLLPSRRFVAAAAAAD